jgi:CRP-like cAMP-binding protein
MAYLEGDTVQQVLLLVSGSIKITQLGSKGLEVILRLGAPGDVFDVVSLSTTGRHRATAEAIRSCGVLVWDAGAFKALLEAIPVLHQNIIRFTYRHLEELEGRFRELATEPVAPRVARQLIRLLEQVGSAQSDEMEIGISRENLAEMTQPFILLAVYSPLGKSGLIYSCSESIIISDVRALRKLFDDD